MANILHKPPLRITIKNAGNRHARRKRPVNRLPIIRFAFRRPESPITMWHHPPLFFQTASNATLPMTAHTYEHKYRLAAQFARRFQDEKRERAEKDTFWNEFFAIFGLDRFRTATTEYAVKHRQRAHQILPDVFLGPGQGLLFGAVLAFCFTPSHCIVCSHHFPF